MKKLVGLPLLLIIILVVGILSYLGGYYLKGTISLSPRDTVKDSGNVESEKIPRLEEPEFLDIIRAEDITKELGFKPAEYREGSKSGEVAVNDDYGNPCTLYGDTKEEIRNNADNSCEEKRTFLHTILTCYHTGILKGKVLYEIITDSTTTICSGANPLVQKGCGIPRFDDEGNEGFLRASMEEISKLTRNGNTEEIKNNRNTYFYKAKKDPAAWMEYGEDISLQSCW